MRQLDPFSYFAEHASAISGFGGAQQGPDPRYCFHTHYEELQAGRAIYRLHLAGARASMGEMTLRVHAYKPDSNADVSLVGGTKQLLERLGTNGAARDMDLTVAFWAVPGVQYALYGYFSEPSDLQVDDIRITVDEHGMAEGNSAPGDVRPTSRFAVEAVETPSRLYASISPSLEQPVSQDCTRRQLAARNRHADEEAVLEQWRADIALAALGRYGVLQEGATGVILGRPPEGLRDWLTAQGCRLASPEGTARPCADFAISCRVH